MLFRDITRGRRNFTRTLFPFRSIKFRDAFPDRFIECFIAEQNLVGVGIGCATRQRTIPFVSTFAAFLTRAFDQIRMGAVSQTNCNFAGSHVGVSIGKRFLRYAGVRIILNKRRRNPYFLFYIIVTKVMRWAKSSKHSSCKSPGQ